MTQDSSGERTCPACGSRYSGATRFCPSDGQPLRDPGESSDALIGSLVADRYYVERRLGLGGMGVVYLAQHVFMSRACALKVLRGEFLTRTDALARFTRGAQNASRIIHRNVAAIHDFGEIAGESMYLAMEYVDGPTLGAVIDREGSLTLARCVTILSQVASALRAAHDLGIVHRDLKPDNIMLAPSAEGDDLVKVVDFGIARALFDEDQRVTQTDALVGTPAYMSPEQLRGRPVDTRSDLYSLGLVAVVMLSGALPLSSDPVDLALRFMQRPRSLAELRPSIDWPPPLQQVIDRALAPDPDDRQRTVTQFAREFIDAVRAWQPAEVTSATAALSRLGVDMSLALPPETIVRIGTPSDSRPLPYVLSDDAARPPRGRLPVTGIAPTETVADAMITSHAPPSTRTIAASPSPARGRWRALALAAVAVASMLAMTTYLVSRDGRDASLDAHREAATDSSRSPAAGGSPMQLATDDSGDSTAPSQPGVPAAVDNAPFPSDSAHQTPSLRAPDAGRDGRKKTAAPLQGTRVEDAPGASTEGRTATAAQDSVGAEKALIQALPNVGLIRIGSAGSIGAALYLNDRLVGVVSTLRTVSAAPGAVRIRLSIERCQDWDSTIMVTRGDTISIGYRRPYCPP